MEYSILTRRGSRDLNEDSALVRTDEKGFCCLLADGLGGHSSGEVASRLATETGASLFEKREPEKTGDFLERCFTEGQKAILREQSLRHNDMKTTLTALAGTGSTLQWGHIGDSRLYYFKNGRMSVRTLDHSVPQMLVSCGEIKEKEIRGHEDRSRLLRVMGGEDRAFRYELSNPIRQEEGTAFLICTDGFWEWVEEKEMERTLTRSSSPEEWLGQMEEILLKRGKGQDMDNYTAVGIFFGRQKKGFLGLF